MKIIKFILVLFTLILLDSCGTYIYNLRLEQSNVSQIGVNTSGKSLAIVYNTEKSQGYINEKLTEYLSKDLIKCFSEKKFELASKVKSFDIKKLSLNKQSSLKDTLINLVLSTQSDIVLLLSDIDIKEWKLGDIVEIDRGGEQNNLIQDVRIAYTQKLYLYDSMNVKDTIVSKTLGLNINDVFNYSISATSSVSENITRIKEKFLSNIEKILYERVRIVASDFVPKWKVLDFHVVSLDVNDKWDRACREMYSFNWDTAILYFLEIKPENNYQKLVQSYDIALCCYLSGDYDLAKKWLSKALDIIETIKENKEISDNFIDVSMLVYKLNDKTNKQ